VRPPAGATNPAETDPRYCIYDERHQDYRSTNAWLKLLSGKLKDPDVFEEVTGGRPRRSQVSPWDLDPHGHSSWRRMEDSRCITHA
jgi:hypothetical protein